MNKNTVADNIITVKKLPNGTFVWALPTHGRMESGNIGYVEDFMYSKNLKFQVVEISSVEAFKLNN